MTDPTFIPCAGGLFTLPPEISASLNEASPKGLIYVRQDDETFTISVERIQDGRRRRLANEMKVAMFRTATKLAILNLPEGVRIMAVEWRSGKGLRQTSSPYHYAV